MNQLLASSLLLASSSAMAHEGMHGHPHGIESYLALGGVLFVIACVAVGLRMAKNMPKNKE